MADKAAASGAGSPVVPKPVVLDELAQDQKRSSLLDVMGDMVRGKAMYTRVLLMGNIHDHEMGGEVEMALRACVGEFNQTVSTEDKNKQMMKKFLGATDDQYVVSGLLYLISSHVCMFLEGSTESIFELLAKIQAQVAPPAGEAGGEKTPLSSATKDWKVQYFTECKGVRATKEFAVFRGSGKMGIMMPDDINTTMRIFGVYRKLIELHTGGADGAAEGFIGLPDGQTDDFYRAHTEEFPHTEDLNRMADKDSNPNAFPLKDFLLEFHTTNPDTAEASVLHSELLWPAPPSLRYYD